MDDTDIQTARLTLLALRAAIPKEVPLGEGQYRLSSGGPLLATEEVIDRLAVGPKPLLCAGSAVDGVLQMDWRPLSTSPRAREWHERSRQLDDEEGGFMAYLVRLYGGTPDSIRVKCCGRDESLFITLAAVQKWRRDYSLDSPHSIAGDGVDNPYCVDSPDYLDARANGAVGILRVEPPTDFHATISIDLTPPQEGENQEAATQRALETVRDITPMLAFLTNSTEFRSSLASFVDETTRFFKGDVPPELAAFLAD